MSKYSSAKYYQDNKERLQKKNFRKNYQSLSKEEKEKSNNTGINYIKISLKMKNKG